MEQNNGFWKSGAREVTRLMSTPRRSARKAAKDAEAASNQRNGESSSAFEALIQNLHKCDKGAPATKRAASTLAEASREKLGKLLDRASANKKKRGGSEGNSQINSRLIRKLDEGIHNEFDHKDSGLHAVPVCGAPALSMETEGTKKISGDEMHVKHQTFDPGSQDNISAEPHSLEIDGLDWEIGESADYSTEKWKGEVTIEVEESAKKRLRTLSRRATAKDKEFAELVHKTHLLCLLARGRFVDAVCNLDMLRVELLAVVPPNIRPLSKEKLKLSDLDSIVKWFSNTFHVSEAEEGPSCEQKADANEPLDFKIHCALQRRSGSQEEIAALAVALFRVLGCTTRYTSVLDVTSIKPDAQSLEASADWDPQGINLDGMLICSNSQVSKAANLAHVLGRTAVPGPSYNVNKEEPVKIENGSLGKAVKRDHQYEESIAQRRGKEKATAYPAGSEGKVISEQGSIHNDMDTPKSPSERAKSSRKGDREFELQLAMAMSATSVVIEPSGTSEVEPALNAQRKNLPTKSRSSSGAIWSSKKGPMLHWAEIFCGGEGAEGRWIHVDAVNGLIDAPDKVEQAAGGRRLPVRYVIAFAGNGAKDVTRRYISSWSKISSHRVDECWWDATLLPLKHLETAATAEVTKNISHGVDRASNVEAPICSSSSIKPHEASLVAIQSSSHEGPSILRSAMEDMELETKTFTEPLPTNQQAYKNHHLYALERWLTRYQILHPKGPVLGYCSGKPVYPRTCVQDVHTSEYWLREGFKVKEGEAPVKQVVRRTPRVVREQHNSPGENDMGMEEKHRPLLSLYGKWQTEAWQPPPAENGIVPKNARGHVDIWSEKSIPPGAVHLRLPRIGMVAKRLEIDYALAMVGFEIRHGRTVPIFDGIVVCEEFKDALLEAYAEEEDSRITDIQKRKEDQAATRWRQLLRSIATRQRLRATYEKMEYGYSDGIDVVTSPIVDAKGENDQGLPDPIKAAIPNDDHLHTFSQEYQVFDEKTGIRTMNCQCGFSYQVEEI